MRYLISLIVLFVAFFFGASDCFTNVGSIALMWNAPSFIIVFLPTSAFAFCTTSWETVKACFRVVFSSDDRVTEQQAKGIHIMLKVSGDMSLMMGILGTFVGFVLIGADLSDLDSLGPNLSVAILTIVYGMIVKTVTYLAEKRLDYIA